LILSMDPDKDMRQWKPATKLGRREQADDSAHAGRRRLQPAALRPQPMSTRLRSSGRFAADTTTDESNAATIPWPLRYLLRMGTRACRPAIFTARSALSSIHRLVSCERSEDEQALMVALPKNDQKLHHVRRPWYPSIATPTSSREEKFSIIL